MVDARKSQSSQRPRRPPARSPEARENQLIALAYDAAEKDMLAGTASSQVITHFLKLGTAREQLERVKLEHETELLRARKEQLDATTNSQELYEKAIQAFRGYRGTPDEAEGEYYDD